MPGFELVPKRSANHSIELYDRVLRKYLASIQDSPPIYESFPHTNKLAIIIEPRYDDITIAVLYNFMHFMSRRQVKWSDKSLEWNFMIITHEKHETEVKKRFPNILFSNIDDKYIELDASGNPNISIQSYNNILLSKQFWSDTIPPEYEQICIFQRDCIMYRPIPRIFEQYAFAGASFGDVITETHFMKSTSFYNGGINGGFSLRSRQHMLLCINAITVETVINYRASQTTLLYSVYDGMIGLSKKSFIDFNHMIQNEDVYFTNACEILGFIMPDILHRGLLAVEVPSNGILSEKTSVYHGWDKGYQSYDTALKYLNESELFSKFSMNIPSVVIRETSKTESVYSLPKHLCD
jgi:hypothetical protein